MTTETDDDLVLTPPEGMEDEAPDIDDDDSEGEEEFSLELEGEEQQEEPPLVKKLRDEIRERDKKLAAIRGVEPQVVDAGPEPTLESCDYDEDAFKAKWREWNAASQQAEAVAAERARAAQLKEAENQQRLINYRAKAAALPVKDFEAAEQVVISRLPEISQAVLLSYTDDPAKMVYALAKHPQMLERIAAEPDPIRQIIMAREMEGKLKVTTRKKPPAPESETIQRGGAPVAVNADKEEARLEKEAERTGDRTALIAYRRQRRK